MKWVNSCPKELGHVIQKETQDTTETKIFWS